MSTINVRKEKTPRDNVFICSDSESLIKFIKKNTKKHIHSFRGSIGCDWSQDSVIELLEKADYANDDIAITLPAQMGNSLATRVNNELILFDIGEVSLKQLKQD